MRLGPYPKNSEIAVGNSVGNFDFSNLSRGNCTVVFEENRTISITILPCARRVCAPPHISPITCQSTLGIIHNSVLEKNSIKNFLSLVSVSPKSRDSLFCNRFDDTISRDKSLSLIRVNLHQHSAVGNFVGNLQGATGVQ